MLTRRSTLALGGAFGLEGAALADEARVQIKNMLPPGDLTWHPEQRVHAYRNGVRIAVSTCSTGRSGHETLTCVFTVLHAFAETGDLIGSGLGAVEVQVVRLSGSQVLVRFAEMAGEGGEWSLNVVVD